MTILLAALSSEFSGTSCIGVADVEAVGSGHRNELGKVLKSVAVKRLPVVRTTDGKSLSDDGKPAAIPWRPQV